MRYRWFILVFLIVAVIAFVVIRGIDRPAAVVPPPTIPSWYEVYFSQVYAGDPISAKAHPNSIDKKLVQKLSSAKTSIDAALHEIDSEPIANGIIDAHQRGVKVRILTETDYMDEHSIEALQSAGIPVANDGGRTGLMHNKFIVVDRRYVWTGSFNTTDNGAYKNNNNAIWIDSPQLAANFTHEFNEMYKGKQFGSRSEKSLPNPIVTMPDGTKIYAYFAPENDVISALVEYIRQARQSIYFMAFSFTHDKLGNAMKERFQAGIDVRGVFETRGSNTSYSEYPSMKRLRIPVMQDTNKWILHHKVIIIDGRTVITGSFNFSQNAATTNDENLLILDGNTAIAQLYTEEFQRVSGNIKPSTISPTSNKRNINTMTKAEIESLPGIGPKLADTILVGRPYRSMKELQKIKGLGPKKLAALKDQIAFE